MAESRDTTQNDGPVLETRELSARFGGLIALDGVSLALSRGSLVSLVGPNGAGKSTLLNAISRLISTTGSVHIGGIDVTATPPQKLPAFGVARTFQDPQLVDSSTVLENVMTGLYPVAKYGMLGQVLRTHGMRQDEAEGVDRAMHELERLGMADAANLRCASLAYGPRKLIDIARALISNPKLVLLDEPSSGLDSGERKRIEQLLTSIHTDRGITLLVVEHHMDLVRAISDRVVALQTGRVLNDGPTREVLDSKDFLRAMVGAAD